MTLRQCLSLSMTMGALVAFSAGGAGPQPAEIQIAADHVIESVKGLRAMGARVADQMGTDRVHRYESIKGNEVIL